jgi:hypothetical protein
MSNKKPTGSPLRLSKYWRIKLGAVMYLAGAMTLLAPISPLHTPPLDPIRAQADPLDLKDYAYKTGLATYGWDKQQSKCLNIQISNGLRYIEHRYKNPCNAWEFWKRNYWY